MELKISKTYNKKTAQRLIAITLLCGFALNTLAANGTWTNPAGGSWATTGNWSGGTIATNTDGTADFSTLTLSSTPTVTLDGARTIGNLTLGDAGNTYGWTLNTGSGGPLTLAVSSGSPTITVNGQTSTIGLVLADANGFTKAGPGTLLINNTPTGNSAVNVNQGVLLVGPSATSLGSGNLTIATGATLSVSNNLGNTAFGGTIVGTGTLDLVTGQPYFTWGAFSGPIIIEDGAQLRVRFAMNGNSPMTLNGSGFASVFNPFGTTSVQVGTLNSASTTSKIRLGGGASLYVDGSGNSSFAGNIVTDAGGTGGIFKSGSGTLTLLGNNTFSPLTGTPAIGINGGILSLGSSGAIGTSAASFISFGGGTLQYSAANTTDYSARFTNSASQAYSIDTAGQSVTFASPLASTGGTLTKNGNGTLALNATNTYSGTTTVNGGILRGSGIIAGPTVVQAGGTLAAGLATGIGSFTIGNTLTLNTGSTNLMRISKTGGVLTNDQVLGLTGVTYGGTLVVSNATSDATALALGDTFTLFPAAGSYANGFSVFNLPALPGALVWDTSALSTSGQIKVAATVVTTVPLFSLPSGAYIGAQTVTISCATAGATIYYTTDGTTPTSSSPSGSSGLTVAIPVNTNITLKAYAHVSGNVDSGVTSASYATVSTPTWINPSGGSWPVAANWSNNVVGTGVGVTADFSQQTLAGPATVTLDSAITVGNLIFGDAGIANNWQVNAGSGGTLTLNAGNSVPSIIVTNQTTTIGTAIAGTNGFTVNGPGTLALNADNSFTGALTVSNGTLNINSPNTYGYSFASAGASLVINSNATVNVSTLYGLGFTTSCNDLTIHDGGTLSLSQDNYVRNLSVYGNAGITLASAGLLRVGGNVTAGSTDTAAPNISSLNLAGSSYGVVGGVTTFTVSHDINQTADLTVGPIGSVSAASVVKTGAGILQLTGANTYSGSTTVSNGTLWLTGSLGAGAVTVATNATLYGNGTISGSTVIQPGGTLATDPSGISTLTINKNLTLTGTVNLRIDSDTSSSDLLQGMTSVTYGGKLTVTDLGSSLAYGQKYTLFTLGSGTYASSFATVTLPTPPTGLAWNTNSLAADGSIQLIYANQVTSPTFNPPGGGYIGAQSVTISSVVGSTIHYTTDGSDPTTSGTVISVLSPATGVIVPVNSSMTLTAYATKAGNANSLNASASYTTLAIATWTNPSGGSWPVAANWLNNVVGTGSGVTADFSQQTLGGPTIVTLDNAITAGNLIFGDAGDANTWQINAGSGGTLTLDAGATVPTIVVTNQTTTINTSIAGTNGFTFNGPGTLALNADNSFTGVLTVNNGTLAVNSPNDYGYSLAQAGSSLVINSNATVIVNSLFGLGFAASCNDLTINDGGTLSMSQNNYVRNLNVYGNAGITLSSPTELRLSGNLVAAATDTAVPNISSLELAGVTYGVVGGVTTVTVSHNPNQVADLIIGPINGASDASMVKTGAGILQLTGANTYNGTTTVSNGTLWLTGSLGASAVTVTANGALSGTGTISGPVTIQAGGKLLPGTSNLNDGLTINSNLTLAGTAVLNISKNGGTPANNFVQGMSTVTFGGTLIVSNLTSDATPLALGDTFQLFSATNYAGTFAATTLPPLGAGLFWNLNSTNGALSVTSGSLTPTNIVFTVTGNTLHLSWPADHLGWTLQCQTNGLSTGLGTNWVSVPGSSTVTSTNITVDPAQPAVFYRLKH